MTEERWHNFAKEKPSEDMEGRNFIVSNGHYEKIATWYGYWENEPFMGDHLCDEVVRWKFYFTPEEEKANEATRTEPKPMKCDELKQVENPIEWGLYYDKSEVDAAIAELKARIQLDDDEMAGFLDLEEECGGGDLRNYIQELKKAHRWRNVRDELPCGMYPVLICVKNANGRSYVTTGHYNSSRNTWYEHVSYGEVKVTHFMDIPKAPDEGKMNERIEKFKFRRQLRKIDWDSVIKETIKTSKEKASK